ncbi:hypothetical protein B0T21DRAFT_421241 [Apiosordaria backusii]|uniref:BRCT domain-containing protein n=1 Tax=Apiosordaria backusii TaxID=314023 RepID=A0AA40F0H6_9PEZI|nr:hypothetical protein B0T21DRAFT_421241 [Apiosordaria backusii]
MPGPVRFKTKDLTFKEKALFSKFTIAVSGSFHNNSKTHWNDTNFTRWITLRGGRYHKGAHITREVTHFVTDEHELQSRSPKAVEALKNKRIQIVPLEWLEFSMINKTVLPIVPGGNLYRVYTDGTFFRYEVDLFRDSHLAPQSPKTPQKQQQLATPQQPETPANQTDENHHEADQDAEIDSEPHPELETPTKTKTDRGEKYTLTLYESTAKPPLYFFCAKYSKSSTDTLPKYYRPSETPQLFWTEYTHFVEFFQKKTGVEWRKRLLFCGPGKEAPQGKRKGKEREVDDGEGGRGWRGGGLGILRR